MFAKVNNYDEIYITRRTIKLPNVSIILKKFIMERLLLIKQIKKILRPIEYESDNRYYNTINKIKLYK